MFKLMICFEEPLDSLAFDKGWQEFLSLVEKMPGVRKEIVSEIHRWVYGKSPRRYVKIHEILFDSPQALDAALKSDAGVAAGRQLQAFTEGRFILLTAQHKVATPEEFAPQPPEESA